VTYAHVLVTRSEDRHVVTVTLNRPAQMNAMNTGMGEDLLACFDALARDPDARAVVFTGAGDKAFCAGGDLKERNGMTDEAWRAQHVIFEQAAMKVLRCPIPVIAAVEGFALAGGCELALLSDFIVAGETAVFGVPETTLGIFPGIGGTQLLPRLVGAALAKELIFTGRRMKADEAKAARLVNHLVPAGQERPGGRASGEEGDRLRQRDGSRDGNGPCHRGVQRDGGDGGSAGRRPRVQREATAPVQGALTHDRGSAWPPSIWRSPTSSARSKRA